MEWTDGKVDPRGFPWPALRDRIARGRAAREARPGQTEPGPSAPEYQPFPGVAFFKRPPALPIVTAMGRRLVAEGCSAYRRGPGPQWTDADRQLYARGSRSSATGRRRDGWPGRKYWNALKVPKV